MKKTAVLVFFAFVFFALFSLAVSADNGAEYALAEDGNSYVLTSYKGNEPEVKIAAEYNGLPVTRISNGAFAGNFSTYKIIIPDSITEIEGGAFSAMSSLYEFEASGAYVSVDGVLCTADKKTLVCFPQARDGEYVIPSGVTVYPFSFSGSSLNTVDARGAVEIGEYAFYLSDVKNITFSETLSVIGRHAFEKSAVNRIVLPGKTTVSAGAFSRCEKLVYADVSQSVLDGEGVFSGDTSLLAVSFPKLQQNIPALCFCGCTSLVTAPTGNSVTGIENKAFYGCTGLKYAYVGGAEVADDAFGLCDNVTLLNGAYIPVPVSKTEITLKANEKYSSVSGGEADLYTDSHFVTINGGEIQARYEGTAEVYAVSRCGDCKAITVTVYDGDAVIQSEHPYGAGRALYVYTVPGNPKRISVTFSSSDSLKPTDTLSVYDINNNCYGVFTGGETKSKTLFIDGDTVRIEIISASGGGYGFRVVSAVPVSSLTAVTAVSLEERVTMNKGETRSLNAAVIPARAYPDELVYVSHNKDVAAVSSDGTVTAVGGGETKISVYSSYYGVFSECTVTVYEYKTDAPDFEYEIIDECAYISRYKGANKNCVIPEYVDGYTVYGLLDFSFSFTDIKSVMIPKTVCVISPCAFDGCGSLTAFTVAEENGEFSASGGSLLSRDKTTLIKVACGVSGEYTIPDTVITVSDCAFAYCFKIDTVNIGENVTELSGKALKGAASLKRINASDGNFTSVDGVLYTADKKTLVYFPAAMSIHTYTVITAAENIGEYAFSGTVNLNGIVLSADVKTIDDTALCEAYSVASVSVNSSNYVFSSKDGCLYEFDSLKFVPKNYEGKFTVPSDTYNILPYAFYNCGMINEIVFDSRVTEIGDYAFGSCRGISTLYLPQSVRKIGYDAFYNDELMTVYIPEKAEITYLSSCRVLCAKDSPAHAYCEENGLDYDFCYYSEYGLYSVYSPVKASVRVAEDKDPVYISKIRAVSGQGVKTFDVYLSSDGVELPAGEYALFRQSTSSERYYFQNNVLSVIEQNAASRYRKNREHIIEFTGEKAESGIAVRTLPYKTEYQKYDEFDLRGLSLYYTDENGITTVVDNGFGAECDTTEPGRKKAVISYDGLVTEIDVTVISVTLTGTVTVKGEPRYNQTLTADISDVLPSGVPLTYIWYRDGEEITGAKNETYKAVKEDIGKSITVKIKSDSDIEGEIISTAVVIMKAKAAIPPKPEVESSDTKSITLKKVDGCEYRLTFEGEFSDENKFTSLTPNTTYVLCQRYRETETTEASAVSSISFKTPEPLKIRTDVYFLNTANTTVSLVEPKTTVEKFLSNFKDGETLAVYKDGKKMSAADTVGTGCEIRLYVDGELYDSYTVAITGDVNGDGKITITDYLQIKERILNNKSLPKEKEYACDVNGDGKVTITDYLRLKYCIQNGQPPEQNRY